MTRPCGLTELKGYYGQGLLRTARRTPERDGCRAQARLPAAGARVSSGQEPRRQGIRRKVQGDQRGLRGPVRSPEAGVLRPVRRRRPARRARARAGSAPAWAWATSSAIFSGSSSAAAAAGRGPRPGTTFGTISRSASRMRPSAPRPRSGFRAGNAARTAMGPGAKSKDEIVTCTACQGAGQIRMQQGFFSISRTCSRCGGEGKMITDPCPACKGRKRVERERTLSVKIPAGVETGNTHPSDRRRGTWHLRRASGRPLRLSYGGGAPALQAGRAGHHLRCADQLCAGGARHGDRGADADRKPPRLKIAAGTQPGHVIRLRGKGFPHLARFRHAATSFAGSSSRSRSKLTSKQKELLQEFERLSAENTTSDHEGIFRQGEGSLWR